MKTETSEASFYMLYVPGGNPPKHKHATKALAEAEAQRILRVDTNAKRVYLLQATEILELEESPIKTTSLI